MFQQLDDTIVAISSPPGISARGVLRLSGPRAVEIAGGSLGSVGAGLLAETMGHRRVGVRMNVGTGSLPAECYVFRAPASYTRQDVVELHVVGSPPLLALLLDQLVSTGARIAEPGEFTARAFFAGAIDLTRVEGVAAAISARTDAQLRASQHLLHGGLGRRMTQFREELVDLLALVEAEIDFVEEAISFVSRDAAVQTIGRIHKEIADLLARSEGSQRLEWLPEVVLLGPPNAGKSTLFNRLTGTDRAIQSAVAGTTRDVLKLPVALPAGEIMLCDSAGVEDVHEESCTMTFDLDALASQETWRAAQTADLVLLVVDAAQSPVWSLEGLRVNLPSRRTLTVMNKADLLPSPFPGDIRSDHGDMVWVSGRTGQGVEELVGSIGGRLFSESHTRSGEVLSLTARQRTALAEAHTALEQASRWVRDTPTLGACAELLAMEVREAASALSLLTGEVTTEDLLGRIFSRFCIGK